MPSDYAASVQGVALRVSSLGTTGAPALGAGAAFTTTAFMRLGFTPEYVDGDEVEEKAANGSVCVYYKMPDVLKRCTISLAICSPEPELTKLLVGGTVLLDGQEPVGYAAPAIGVDPNPNGVAVEVWSRAVVAGKMAATNPYWRWVFPFGQFKMTGERALENGMMANEFEGWSVGNTAWGTGPAGDWTYGADKAFQYARDDNFPTIVGATTVPFVQS